MHMRNIATRFMPRSTNAIASNSFFKNVAASRYTGRLIRPTTGATSSPNGGSSGPLLKVTAAKIAQRIIGGSFMRAKDKKALDVISQKPHEAQTAAERAFLKKYHERSSIKPIKSEQLKN